MIIDNFNFVCSVLSPHKTDPKSIVDPDAMLAPSTPLQRFQSIAWRNPHVGKGGCRIKLIQLPNSHSPYGRGTCTPRCCSIRAVEDVFGSIVFERPDHETMIARNSCYLNTEDTYTAREAAEKCMMEDVIKESVSYSESNRKARTGRNPPHGPGDPDPGEKDRQVQTRKDAEGGGKVRLQRSAIDGQLSVFPESTQEMSFLTHN